MSNEITIILGAPRNTEERIICDHYQCNPDKNHAWMDIERETAKRLFDRNLEPFSPFEDLCAHICQQNVRIAKYELGFGKHKGYWTAPITIEGEDILDAEGVPIRRIQDKPHFGLILKSIMYISDRRWVVALG